MIISTYVQVVKMNIRQKSCFGRGYLAKLHGQLSVICDQILENLASEIIRISNFAALYVTPTHKPIKSISTIILMIKYVDVSGCIVKHIFQTRQISYL